MSYYAEEKTPEDPLEEIYDQYDVNLDEIDPAAGNEDNHDIGVKIILHDNGWNSKIDEACEIYRSVYEYINLNCLSIYDSSQHLITQDLINILE